jgi:hypothetical protein
VLGSNFDTVYSNAYVHIVAVFCVVDRTTQADPDAIALAVERLRAERGRALEHAAPAVASGARPSEVHERLEQHRLARVVWPDEHRERIEVYRRAADAPEALHMKRLNRN